MLRRFTCLNTTPVKGGLSVCRRWVRSQDDEFMALFGTRSTAGTPPSGFPDHDVSRAGTDSHPDTQTNSSDVPKDSRMRPSSSLNDSDPTIITELGSRWLKALQHVSALRYASDDVEVDEKVHSGAREEKQQSNALLNRACQDALEAFSAKMQSNVDARFSKAERGHWQLALNVWNMSPAKDAASQAALVSTLYLSNHVEEALRCFSWHPLQGLSHSIGHGAAQSSVLGALRCCAMWTLCQAAASERSSVVDPSLHAALHDVRELARTVQHAQQVTRKWSGAARDGAIREYELLFLSLEWWIFVRNDQRAARKNGRSDDDRKPTAMDSVVEAIQDIFSPLVVPRYMCDALPFLCGRAEDASRATWDRVCSRGCCGASPSLILVSAQEAVMRGDTRDCQDILRVMRGCEERNPALTVLPTSLRIPNSIALCPGMPTETLAMIAKTYGTALHSDVCQKLGTHHSTQRDILTMLARRSTPEDYFLARSILERCDVNDARKYQETHGDLLTGDDMMNWQLALALVDADMRIGDGSWRRSRMPTALRLLSDVGKDDLALRLFRESSAAPIRTDHATALHTTSSTAPAPSIVTASAVCTALKTTGRWWNAIEAFDLLVSTKPSPEESADRHFMEDSCMKLLELLRNHRRWHEALELYRSLHTAMPPRAHNLICSVVTNMSSNAPWLAALQVIQSCSGEIDEKFCVSLLCAHNPEAVPVANICNPPNTVGDRKVRIAHHQVVQAKYALFGYSTGGHWRECLRVLKSVFPDGGSEWFMLLRALENNAGDTASPPISAVWGEIPLSMYVKPAFVQAAIRAATLHGELMALRTAITDMLVSQATSEDNADSPAAPPGKRSPTASQRKQLKEYLVLLRVLTTGRRPRPAKSGKEMILYDAFVAHQLLLTPALREARQMSFHWPTLKSKKAAEGKTETNDGFVDRKQVAAHFRLPESVVPRNVRVNDSTHCIRLKPLEPALFVPDMLLYHSAWITVAWKAPGALTEAVAKSVLNHTSSTEPHSPVYLLPINASGAVVLMPVSTSRARVGVILHMVLRIRQVSQNAAALLNCNFFRNHRMALKEALDEAMRREGSTKDSIIVSALCSVGSINGESIGTLTDLETSMSFEGWAIDQRNANNSDEVCMCVTRVRVTQPVNFSHLSNSNSSADNSDALCTDISSTSYPHWSRFSNDGEGEASADEQLFWNALND